MVPLKPHDVDKLIETYETRIRWLLHSRDMAWIVCAAAEQFLIADFEEVNWEDQIEELRRAVAMWKRSENVSFRGDKK